MPAKVTVPRSLPKPCATIDDPQTADLTWLMHRAVTTLSGIFDAVCREAGLVDLRDWLVLATVADGERRTQYELSQALGIDKSTLMSIVDRLEQRGLLVRELSPADRRVRYPVTTDEGARIAEAVTEGRARAISDHLRVVDPAEQVALRSALWSILTGESTSPTGVGAGPELAAARH
jgi:DNA-binding MarR family transcriptional regulator